MNKDKFLKTLPILQKKLGSVEKIVIGSIGGPYSRGCFYDESEKNGKYTNMMKKISYKVGDF